MKEEFIKELVDIKERLLQEKEYIDNMYKYSSTDAYIWIEYEFENYTDSKALLDDVL